jgi:hypothetical protein
MESNAGNMVTTPKNKLQNKPKFDRKLMQELEVSLHMKL